MRRNRPTRGTNHLIRTCVLAAFLVGSLFAPRISAQTAGSYRHRAAELARAKSWDDAITNYRKALELEPNDAVTHYDLAWALKYKGESREALKEFQAALKLRPKWADAHYGIGVAWYDLQDQDSAVKELRTAEALDPLNAATHRLLARILAQQDSLPDAERELKLALRLKPLADTHLELGVVEGQLGNLNEAAAQFRRAIQLDSRLVAAHLMLGIVLRRQSKHADALSQFRAATALQSGPGVEG
jgi:tetratricopeptide (TPR) repeat protein